MKNPPPRATIMRRLNLLMLPCCLMSISGMTFSQEIPSRPEQLQFATLDYEPPSARSYRHALTNKVVVYLAPSAEIPLVNISFTFRGGDYLDPQGLVGVAEATGALIREGGTISIAAEDLDERLDFLAANVASSAGKTFSTITLNCLKSNLNESFTLFMDMIRNPGFQSDRITLYHDEQLEAMRQRNDFPAAILNREWMALLYGRDHFEARQITESMIQAMTIADLQAMHQKIYHPGNLVIAVSGDFEPRSMLAKLTAAMQGWDLRPPAPEPPAPQATFTPGIYHVERDIPQGKVFIGLRTIPRDHPDFFPMLVMNEILGGGGFTSRITSRVRSDEGLAYSAGSRFSPRVDYPGEFRASFQSKNPTVALSIKLIFEEIQSIRTQPVTEEELSTARSAFIETFPRTFESKQGMLNVFVSDELTGRDPEYWKQYRQNISSVTPEQITDVAKRYLDPAQMAIFVVGSWDMIYVGDPDKRASMSEFFNGDATHLPLRNPMSMEPIR